jgi:hydrogenase maturation protein HypF
VTRERRVLRLARRVQGRGLRPSIARIAKAASLTGSVRNTRAGVELVLEGDSTAIDRAVRQIEASEACDVVAVSSERAAGQSSAFVIADSDESDAPSIDAIVLDRRICAACTRELDHDARRAGYALNACVECGPRFTAIEALPYDRARTTMRAFAPCPACESEYRSLDDRRAHAQMIACPTCGPQYSLRGADGCTIAAGAAAIERAVEAIARGKIIAMLGVGGFQLLCDGRDARAIAELRRRKRRPHKPFALLVESVEHGAALAQIDALERAALESPAGPIVLVRKRGDAVLAEVAPGLSRVGLLLPTSAAHALIARAIGGPVVCTSGNARGEPIVTDVEESFDALAGIADAWLVHDRPIAQRADDSVVQVIDGRARVRRLGRGMAPLSFEVGGGDRLCVGAHRDVSPVLVVEGRAWQWPYVGAMDTRAARAAFARAVRAMCELSERTPLEYVCDAHPDYATTQWAEQRSPVVTRVLHHHAHVAATLAEHGARSALGFAWDGTGLGPDRSLAGGEVLSVSDRGARWVARLRPFALVGGDAAARDGRRAYVGAAREAGAAIEPALAPLAALCDREAFAPRSSSVGRLFDAVSFALGLCERGTYEGHAAMLLEAIALGDDVAPYPFRLDGSIIDWRELWHGVLRDRADAPLAAARFHRSLVAVIDAVCERHDSPVVALAGGCFNNALLLEKATHRLRERGRVVLSAERVAAGDGAIALGQSWVSATEARRRVTAL